MRLIHPSVTILTPTDGVAALRFIERMARISHHAEAKQTEDSWQRFIDFVVLDKGDWSVVEHVSSTVLFRVNRGVTHELVRHRLFSFTQESTRFVNGRKSYPNGLEFVAPAQWTSNNQGGIANETYKVCEDAYLNLLDMGFRPQEARAVLPNALAATIAVTGNLRNWRHFLIMRTTKETHPDFREVTIPLLADFKKLIPLLFDDIEPEQKQSEAIRKAR